MQILKVKDVGIEAAALAAAEIIRNGGLVVYPTDTLYGLGANALNTDALDRLRYVKARESRKPLSIITHSVDTMSHHAHLTPEARELADRFLPGALTLVIPAKEHLPKELILNNAIGVRVPNDPFTQLFAAASEYPITATSANLAGMETPHTVEDIVTHFGPKMHYIDLFVDDGPRSGGVASTVVTFVDGQLRVLREGAISKADLGL